jgi:D-alanine-D-alanine ligase
LGVRGFGRIDVKMNSNGHCFFLEANLVPGMTVGSSYFPRACEIANDLTYDAVVCLMLDECLGRAAARPELAKLSKTESVSCAAQQGLLSTLLAKKDIGDQSAGVAKT